MSTPPSISLTPIRTAPGEPAFQALLTWPFAEQPFYEGQVKRLLRNDIPQRLLYSSCLIWVYRDSDGNVVGFATLDVCKDYERFTAGKSHGYIPLLAVNPQFQKRGHGYRIVQHLIAEAVQIAHCSADISDYLFLDVYPANQAAISLYAKCGFVTLNPDAPVPDPQENNEPYVIMAKKVVVAPA